MEVTILKKPGVGFSIMGGLGSPANPLNVSLNVFFFVKILFL